MSNSYFMDSVVQYLNRGHAEQSEQALLEENRQLRILLQQASDAYNQMHDSLTKNKALVAQLIDGNYPKVTNQNGFLTKCYRIIKFRETMLRQNGIDPSNTTQINQLSVDQKRIINLNILAFGELLSLPEVCGQYLRKTQARSMDNAIQEADILGQAITKNKNTQVHALQAWGYLNMMMSVNNGTIHYLDIMLETFNNEAKANEWLKDRVSQLTKDCRFATNSTMPNPESIPNPLQLWEIKSAIDKHEGRSLSMSVSGNRPEFVFNVNDPYGYPNSPKGNEIIFGPINFSVDEALVWGAKLIATNEQSAMDELVDQTISGERRPTLLNNDKDLATTLPDSSESVAIPFLDKYGIN